MIDFLFHQQIHQQKHGSEGKCAVGGTIGLK